MIRFGPSGNCKRFYDEGHSRTAEAPEWIAEQGLTAYEYSFGRGINISDATAAEIGTRAVENGVEISVHAPYYINFANTDDTMAEKSYAYVLNSCRKLQFFQGRRVVFHPSTVGKLTRAEAVELTRKRLEILADKIVAAGLDGYLFCPETMGKINQIGDLYEVAEFCRIADFYVPTVDFGHLNARTYGSLKSSDDYEKLIVHLLETLGYEKTSSMHIHFSKIQYGAGGEIRHLTFADEQYGPEFAPLAVVLKKYRLEPVIISESDDTQADDALEMKRIYENTVCDGGEL